MTYAAAFTDLLFVQLQKPDVHLISAGYKEKLVLLLEHVSRHEKTLAAHYTLQDRLQVQFSSFGILANENSAVAISRMLYHAKSCRCSRQAHQAASPVQ